MLRKTLLWGIVAALIMSTGVGVLAKKPDHIVARHAARTASPEKLLVETLKAELKISSTLSSSIAEIRNALTLSDMLERAHHNDRKIERIIQRFERYAGPLDSSPYYIEVFNVFVGESVWIDPIHICGQGDGYL